MSLKGTQTEKNLMAAFAGESQARNRYTYFAGQAKKEGLEQISAIFEETANQEKEHAKRFFKFLEGGDVEVVAAFPAGVIGATVDNLKAAAAGEYHETGHLYPEFAVTAEKEGFKEISAVFHKVAVAEKRHGDRFTKFAENIEKGIVFKRKTVQRWACRNCGYIHEGLEAPGKCPACLHPTDYFEIEPTNF